MVCRFHGKAAATRALEDFIARFQQGAMPEVIPEVSVMAKARDCPIANLLKDAGLVKQQPVACVSTFSGGVRIDGERLGDRGLSLQAGSVHIFQVGKRRFVRVSVITAPGSAM